MEDLINQVIALMQAADIPMNAQTINAVFYAGANMAGFMLGVMIAGLLIGIFVLVVLELILDTAIVYAMYRKYPVLKVERAYQILLRRKHKLWTRPLYLEADGTARLAVKGKRPVPSAEVLSRTLQRPVEVERDYRGRSVIVISAAATQRAVIGAERINVDSLAHFLEYVFGEVMMGVIQEMLLILERSGVPVTYESLDALVRSSLVLFALFLAFLIVGIVIGWVIRLSWNLGTDIGNDIIKYRKYPALKTVDAMRKALKKGHKVTTHHANFYLGADGTIRLEVEGKRPLPSAEDLSRTLQRAVAIEQDYTGKHVIIVGPAAA